LESLTYAWVRLESLTYGERRRLLMRAMACILGLVLAASLVAGADDPVDLKVVKYAGLGDIIKSFKGKVVVVDFWADT
jgi:hypothetical protein